MSSRRTVIVHGRVTISDPARDVWLDKNVSAPVIDEVQPDRKVGDITSLTVEYGDDTVTVSLDLVERPREPSPLGGDIYVASVDTPDGAFQIITADDETAVGLLRDREEVQCADHGIEVDAARVTLSVDRSCLGDPEWVRVSAATGFMYYPNGGDSDVYIDFVPGTGDPELAYVDDHPNELTDKVWWPGAPAS